MDAFLDWVIAGVAIAIALVVALWIAGAIYFDIAGGARWGKALGVGWVVAAGVLPAVWEPLWHPLAVEAGVSLLFLAWWFGQKPRQDRDWDLSVAVLPRFVLNGDTITVENLRNFDYHGPGKQTPRYTSRTVRLSQLATADIIFFNWGSPWMSHPVLVFDFGPDGRVCISIEVRYRQGQGFSMLRSLYRQQELAIVVADERDVILRRTRFSTNQTGRLYRLSSPPEELREVFLDYVGAVNGLFERPRWYHGLCMNCTTTFYRLPSRRVRLDWRVLANGLLDRALYEDGRIENSMPFEELHRHALINDIANAAPEVGFGEHLRHELERRHHER